MPPSCRQLASLGPVTDVVPTLAGVDVTCAGGRQRIEVLGDGVVRLRVSPDRAWRAAEDWDVLRVPAASDVEFVVVKDDDDRCVVDAGTLSVEIGRANGGVRFVTDTGVAIAADAGDDAVSWGAHRMQVRKRRHRDERHAGFGERSALDQTAGTKSFWNVNAKQYGSQTDGMYCSVPVFLAHRPSVTFGFFLNALGWSQIRADPDANTWIAEVAAGIRRRATATRLTKPKRRKADLCATYLVNKAPYLDYPTALAAGWPIATGIIEGACRHLVKDRMDITGARWGLDGAETVLKLRAVRTNGDSPAHWRYDLNQERQRVHQTRYTNSTIPQAA